MELGEKFIDIFYNNKSASVIKKEAVKLADEHAVDFANWLLEKNDKPSGEFTISELIEIYNSKH